VCVCARARACVSAWAYTGAGVDTHAADTRARVARPRRDPAGARRDAVRRYRRARAHTGHGAHVRLDPLRRIDGGLGTCVRRIAAAAAIAHFMSGRCSHLAAEADTTAISDDKTAISDDKTVISDDTTVISDDTTVNQ
jgi:hypothetical protein